MFKNQCALLLFIILSYSGYTQDDQRGSERITGIPGRFFEKINSTTSGLEVKLEKQTEEYLQRLAKKEKKLKRHLARIDFNAAKELFRDLEQQYAALQKKMLSNSPIPGGGWGEAGLIGLSKVVSLKSKLFKKTKLQLFRDFLSYEQVPGTQAIKFRIGYSF